VISRRHQLLFELLTKVRLNVEIRITCDVWRIECFISIPPWRIESAFSRSLVVSSL